MKEPNLMEITRAAVTLVNSTWHTKAGEYFAFLTLMHPEIKLEKRLKMANDMASKE